MLSSITCSRSVKAVRIQQLSVILQRAVVDSSADTLPWSAQSVKYRVLMADHNALGAQKEPQLSLIWTCPGREEPVGSVLAEEETESGDTVVGSEESIVNVKSCCGQQESESKYRCPVCDKRICSLKCYRSHQADGCSGQWETTRHAYIPRNSYNLDQLLRDYAFLEDLNRRQQGHRRQFEELSMGGAYEHHRFAGQATVSRAQRKRLFVIARVASERGIRFHLLPEMFAKHRRNTSVYRPDTNCIEWRLECHLGLPRLAPAERVRVLERCSEHMSVAQVLERLHLREMVGAGEHYEIYLQPDRANHPRIPIPAPYDVAVADVLRAAECIIEFPTLEVLPRSDAGSQASVALPTLGHRA